jgi:hypothetical protein
MEELAKLDPSVAITLIIGITIIIGIFIYQFWKTIREQ